MMTSLDGRIDCAMTSLLPGVEDYYATLDALNVPTTVSGRVTAELEMAEPGVFETHDATPFGKESFSKKADADGYEIVVDTHGKLLWPNADGMEKPYLIITSENTAKEYLRYLDEQNISWIACGNEKVDLARAMEILAQEFDVQRVGMSAERQSIPPFWTPDCWTRSAFLSAPESTDAPKCLLFLMGAQ